MVVAKNAELIGHYYDPDFLMYSDGMCQTFTEYSDSHRRTYATSISYAVEYDPSMGSGRRQDRGPLVDHHVSSR